MKQVRKVAGVCIAIAAVASLVRAEHPEVLVHPGDRDAMLAKIEKSAWAHGAYQQLKARVDTYVALCRKDPQFLSSRLFMNWQTHYTVPICQKSRWVGGDGHAPVPTPRFAGARDWATKYQAPEMLEDLRPYNDNEGKVWLLNRDTQQEGWVDPGLTGRLMETVNERIVQLAADASFIYWLTGDEQYASFASEILWTYMHGFYYVQTPRLPPGDKSMAPIIGVTSFEVIHEGIVIPLSVSYDFLHDYLQKQGKDVSIIQTELKRFGRELMSDELSLTSVDGKPVSVSFTRDGANWKYSASGAVKMINSKR